MATGTSPRGAYTLGVQRPRDRPESGAPGRQAENVSDGRRLVLADLAYDVRALTALVDDGDVAVTEDGAAGHIPALSLELERITGSLAGLRALQLGRKVRDRHDQLVDGALEPHLMATVLVFEDAHARHADLFEDVVGLELLAPQAVLVGHEEAGERSLRAEGVEEPHQAGSPIELRPGDRVVDVDVLGRHLEAVCPGAGDGQLDLPRDRLLLVADCLVSGLPGVDRGGAHHTTSGNRNALARSLLLLAAVVGDQQGRQRLGDPLLGGRQLRRRRGGRCSAPAN